MSLVLTSANLAQINSAVALPTYDRKKVKIGIVHLGPGAFHRAHQAVYADDLLNTGDLRWGICEVSIRSSKIRDVLKKQDNLYTLAVLDIESHCRVIGSIQEVLVAPENPSLVIDRMSLASVKVLSLTVTEKGYCLTQAGRLDKSRDDIQYDLKHIDRPTTAIGFVVAGLYARWKIGAAPFVPLTCDNLVDNGHRLRAAVLDFAEVLDQAFYLWVSVEVHFPCTMVDSITPATNDDIACRVSESITLRDEWPIQRELFTQWVIEDIDGVELPPFDLVGATFSNNVAGYEAVKLRVLNGLHSSLAMLGYLLGKSSVDEAISHPALRKFTEALLKYEIIPTLSVVEGLDVREYGEAIIQRFLNPSIRHLLSQIAWDSSQKLPFRILGSVEDNLKAGRSIDKLSLVLAAWMHFVRQQVSRDIEIIDPLSETLKRIARLCKGGGADVTRFLSLKQVFSNELRDSARFQRVLMDQYERLERFDFPEDGLDSILLQDL